MAEAGWAVNFLGVRTRQAYWAGRAEPSTRRRFVRTGHPPVEEEYFEWIDVLEAVVSARPRFTMVELGAGWGRWLVNGACAARRCGLPYQLVGVEAEPTHVGYLRTHLADNAIPPESVTLFDAAVTTREGTIGFHVGDPDRWYGQKAIELPPDGSPPRLPPNWPTSRTVTTVRAVSFRTVLAAVERADLLDLDIQGAEAEVLESAREELDAKVARIHVGTHSIEQEERLRALFRGLGWTNVNDYTLKAEQATPFGVVSFRDGVQTWLNPDQQPGRR